LTSAQAAHIAASRSKVASVFTADSGTATYRQRRGFAEGE
jgi:hypothetical protein